MLWVVVLLSAASLASASLAHGVVEVVQLVITSAIKVGPAVDATGSRWDPADEMESISYPGRGIFFTRLRGFEPGRTYSIRMIVLDAQQRTVVEHTWPYLAISQEEPLFFDVMPDSRNEPGEWRLVVEVDGRRIAERTIHGVRSGPLRPPLVNVPRASPALAAIEATQLVVATHVMGSSEPGIDRVPANDLPSIEYPLRTVFYARLRGLEADRSYSARGLVLDAKQQTATEHSWTFVPKTTEAALYFQLTTKARSEPGEWRLIVEVDGQRIAERAIPAVR